MSDLSEVEARIVELCERAKVELGWRFMAAQFFSSRRCRGCALEACATVLGHFRGEGRMERPNWQEAARAVGLTHEETTAFGVAFDWTADSCDPRRVVRNKAAQLATRLARRFVHGEEP